MIVSICLILLYLCKKKIKSILCSRFSSLFLIIPFTLARLNVILCMDYSILTLFVSDSSSSPKLLKSKIDDFMFTILMISYQVLNINCPKIYILFALRTKYMYVHLHAETHCKIGIRLFCHRHFVF